MYEFVDNYMTTSFPCGSMVQNPPDNAGDMHLIPGSGRSPGGGNGNPLQYSCLESPTMDKVAWRATAHLVAKSPKQLSRHAWQTQSLLSVSEN